MSLAPSNCKANSLSFCLVALQWHRWIVPSAEHHTSGKADMALKAAGYNWPILCLRFFFLLKYSSTQPIFRIAGLWTKYVPREAKERTDVACSISCLMHSTVSLSSWKRDCGLFLTLLEGLVTIHTTETKYMLFFFNLTPTFSVKL